MNSKIILPLDNVPWQTASEIMQATKGQVWGYKIRRSILERGLRVISEIKKFGNVMLDFKLFDIPSAMTESLKLHIDSGADITTVHCTSGYDPASHGLTKDHIAGVTVLTSMNQNDFDRYYKGGSLLKMIERMAQDALSRYEYLVCSAQDLEHIRNRDIKKICPGIRPRWYLAEDDQARTATPAEAIQNGADLLVIGRPILKSDNPVDAVQRSNAEIAEIL
ncbi:MAG: orotidine-5'-phosphate decarboxylase [Deltaproteobacteria bacterium]|nr:MAG: orotidine-5'-phosphate decarboxylase [Deltaproteobacteria bacterium]